MSENLVQGIMLENGQIGIIDYDYLANKPSLDNYALKENIKSFIITVEDTGRVDDGGYSLYKIDRTYQEIETAYNNGQRLQLFTPSNRLIDLTRFNSKDGSFDFETLGDSANIFEWWWLEKDGILMRADYSIVTANGESIEAFSRFDNHTKMFREALGNNLVEITLKDGSKKTVIKGDGQQHCVYVPGGVYVINDTIVIPENCSLTLSQDTILRFTQTSGNCIEMRGSATLNGNHGNIDVSQDFTGNVISVDTGLDGVVHASIPPYIKSTPMWKRQRFIENINITKTESHGFQAVYSKTSEISGTALYISANYETEEVYAGTGNAPISFIWGMAVSGLRIAGAFKYGINIQNRDKTDSGYGDDLDPAWNHDMRIEAVIVSCETGVRVFNCNTAHLAVTIQPATSIQNGIVYAKNGIVLEHSQNIDLSSSIIWDWDPDRTLYNPETEEGKKNSHIALYGNCVGLILSDQMHNKKSDSILDVRQIIYTDTPKNLKTMNILQESVIRWFSPGIQEIKDSGGAVVSTKIIPTFTVDENQSVNLLTEDDMSRFITDKYQVAEFENLAKDKILLRTRLVAASGNTSTSDPDYDSYYFTVDYFPFDITKPLFFENFYISKIKKNGAYGEASSSVIQFYDSSKKPIPNGNYLLFYKFDWAITGSTNWSLNWEYEDVSNSARKVTKISVPETQWSNATWKKVAFARICSANSVNPTPENVIISSTPIQYSEVGKLAAGIAVETNQILNFEQNVNDLIAAQLLEVENGSY